MVAWLSAEGWTAEELSFVEMYWGVFGFEVEELNLQRVRKLMKIFARQEAQKGERNREYDSKNILKGKDSPSWFGESINRDLFK
jgi:hypothetical protein